jgi:glucan biosynthesis protein
MRRINQKSNPGERDSAGWTEDKYLNDYDLIRMLHNRALKKESDQPVERPIFFSGMVKTKSGKPVYMHIVDNGNNTYLAYKPNGAKLQWVVKDCGEWRLL